MQQVALGHEHQRIVRGQRGHGFARAGKEFDLFGQHLLRQLNQSLELGTRDTPAGQINGGFNQRQDEARHAVAVVVDVGDLDAIDDRFDLVLGERDAGIVEQALKSTRPARKLRSLCQRVSSPSKAISSSERRATARYNTRRSDDHGSHPQQRGRECGVAFN